MERRRQRRLTRLLKWSSKMAGKPQTFFLAVTFVMIWVLGGFFLGFSDTWLLIINTIGTISAALMVFIIQNTQNRETKALHIKIDELILAVKEAENELVAIEEIEEEELDKIRALMLQKKIQAKTRNISGS